MVINSSGCAFWNDMYVLNEDTLWVVDSDGLCGGVVRTTNGGVNWTQQLSLGSNNPTHIYFYNKDIGFTAAGVLYKTTNSGVNWFNTNQTGFGDMNFINELTGWKCYGPIQKTTDGGLNWVSQQLPTQISGTASITSLSFLNKDTIWGCNGFVIYPNSQARGVLYITTNGGTKWFYGVPDTTIHSGRYQKIKFTDKNKGWAAWSSGLIHTKVGGDPITLITYSNSEIPKNYILYQNYPNPFNPNTAISYQLSIAGYASIKIYDLRGKEISSLINQKKNAGSYEINFDAKNLSSGIYFYSLIIDGRAADTKKMILVK